MIRHHSVFSMHREQRSQPRERWAESEEARCLHHSEHQGSAKVWEGRASTHGTKKAQVEEHCGHIDSSLSGKRGFFRHCKFQPWLPECLCHCRENESRTQRCLHPDDNRVTRRKSPLKETSLLLEGFLEHKHLSVWQILVWFWGVGSVRVQSTEVISTLFYKHLPLSKDFQNFSGTFFPEFYLVLRAPGVFLPRASSPWNTQCVQYCCSWSISVLS